MRRTWRCATRSASRPSATAPQAEENSRRVSHSSNTDAPRTNKQRLAAAELQKKGGAVSFKDLDFKSAARHFLDGVQLAGCQNPSGETAKQVNELQLFLLLNLAMCWLKLEKWTKGGRHVQRRAQDRPNQRQGAVSPRHRQRAARRR